MEIVITQPDGAQTEVTLEENRRYSIGRSQSNDIAIPDLSLSRLHASIYFEGEHWVIADCKSHNGTLRNGVLLDAPARLEPGVQFMVGNCTLIAREAAPDEGDVKYSDGPVTVLERITVSADIGLDAGLDTRLPPGGEVRRTIEILKRRLAVVEKANLELLTHEPLSILLPKILDLVFQAVRPDRAALLRLEDGEFVCRAVQGDWKNERVSISRTIARLVLEEHASVLTADAKQDVRFAEMESIEVQEVGSAMAVPLWNNREVIGLVYADTRRSTGRFSREDLKILTMLANIAAIQMENALLFEEQVEKSRLSKEAQAAATIQQRLLPAQPPSINGYRFIGRNVPCYEVGGDYYDCIEREDGRRAIVIGDVAGKGMGAALLMAVLQATFHAHARTSADPRTLIADLNRAICRSAPSNRFVTLFYADLDPLAHRLLCINAGHAPSPLIVRASGAIEEVAAGDPPLGIFSTCDYNVFEARLEPGDFVFTCSDGVTDIISPEDEMFGDERVRSLLTSNAGLPIEGVHAALSHQLKEHARGTRQPDDLTLIMLQRNPATAQGRL